MRVFLDECVDWRLARHITDHDVRSARDMGWTGVKNGALLSLAAAQFEAFVTVDRNLSFQQNTTNLPIAVIILTARSNRLSDLIPLVPDLVAALNAVTAGSVITVRSTGSSKGDM